MASAPKLVDGRQHQPVEWFERFDFIRRRYVVLAAHLFEGILRNCGRTRWFADAFLQEFGP